MIKNLQMKDRIKRWLGIDKLENDNEQLRKRMAIYKMHVSYMTKKLLDAEARALDAEARALEAEKSVKASSEIAMSAKNRVDRLADVFMVGLDWSPSGYDRSWVVICIKGKMERVQFMDVSGKDAREIKKFLSIFNSDRVTVDAGPGYDFF